MVLPPWMDWLFAVSVRYGDHTLGCPKRKEVVEMFSTPVKPKECDCGWLAVLRVICGQGPLTQEQIRVGQAVAEQQGLLDDPNAACGPEEV